MELVGVGVGGLSRTRHDPRFPCLPSQTRVEPPCMTTTLRDVP